MTVYEWQWAAEVGIRRQIESIRQGRPDTEGKKPEDTDWNSVVDGSCAELAMAKFLRIPWQPAINNYRVGGDVAGYEIRQTRYKTGKLRVHPNCAEAVYVLVTGRAPVLRIVGWQHAHEAKRVPVTVQKNGREAMHWLTQEQLEPLHTLPGLDQFDHLVEI